MKHKLKKITFVIIYIIVSIICGTFIANKSAISNIFNNNRNLTFTLDNIVMYNWSKENDTLFYSELDPQIIIQDLNCYVNDVKLYINMNNDSNEQLSSQIFYKQHNENEFTEKNSYTTQLIKENNYYKFNVNKEIKELRIDLFNEAGKEVNIDKIEINSRQISFSMIYYLLFIVFFILIFLLYKMRNLILQIWDGRKILISLIKNDIRSRYAGSFFGVIWAFAQPLVTILVFWFVFELGFKNPPVDNIQYILWFIPAYIPWLYFTDGVVSSTSCLTEYSYLVKKIKFRTSLLPIVKIMSSLYIHLFFVGFMVVIFAIYGYAPKLMYLQIIYYIIALSFLLCGISMIVSSISVFMKDFTQIISILLQIGFFLIPIFWNPKAMNTAVLLVLKLNPLYYIVQGYRDTFIDSVFFWERPLITVYYWCFSFIIFILGTIIYKRLRPHFADML